MTVPSIPLDSQAVSIPLHAGWNIITNPYSISLTWLTIKSVNGISDPLWGFNGGFISSVNLNQTPDIISSIPVSRRR